MENVTYLPRLCPRCGKALVDEAPEGLCAACLLAAATETLTHATLEDALTVPARGGAPVLYAEVPRLTDGQAWGPYRIGLCSVAVGWVRSTRPSTSTVDDASR